MKKEETLSDIFNKKFYINESVIQEAVSKHGGIEFSMTGDLIPVEVVEVAIGDFIKKVKDEIDLKLKEGLGLKRHNFFINGEKLKDLINTKVGEKFK